MRKVLPARLEAARMQAKGYKSKPGDRHGIFELVTNYGVNIRMISSGIDNEYKWEHVSVTVSEKRCPLWVEMCLVKNLFWAEDEVVMQLHPSAEEYVNCHPYCLHLWRPIGQAIPTPPSILVGPT